MRHAREIQKVCRCVTGAGTLALGVVGCSAPRGSGEAAPVSSVTAAAALVAPLLPSGAAPMAPTVLAPVEPAPTTGVAGSTGTSGAAARPALPVAFVTADKLAAAPSGVATGAASGASAPSSPPTAASLGLPAVSPRRGPPASGESYDAWLETTGAYTAGAPASVTVVLGARAPFKCNVQYPYKLALDAPPAGVTYPSSVARGMHVDGKHASMAVPFTPSRAGTLSIGGTLSFSTCTKEQCLVDKVHLSVPVEVR